MIPRGWPPIYIGFQIGYKGEVGNSGKQKNKKNQIKNKISLQK